MSFDMVELIRGMDFKEIRLQIALQCAPVIAGIKASNLFTIEKEKMNELEKILLNTGLSHEALYVGKDRAVFLVYRYSMLTRFLEQEKVRKVLFGFGYAFSDLRLIFPIFRKKYEIYMRDRDIFPHELGLLLEYPIEDVIGFIKNKGKNCLLTGYWKVYSDKENKKRLFEQFERVQKEIVILILEDRALEDIIHFYRELGQSSVPNHKEVQVA